MKAAFILWILLTLPPAARIAAQNPTLEDHRVRIERLVGLGKVWGRAKYFHPTLADRPDIDWDAALVAAIPQVRRARTRDEYAAAVEAMLELLDDPLTRVVRTPAARQPDRSAEREFGLRWTRDSVLLVNAGNYFALSDPSVQQKLQEVAASIPRARAVVFDLRATFPTEMFGRLQVAGTFSEIQRLLVTDTLSTPGERRRVYYGFESPSPFSSGQYRTGYFVPAIRLLTAD